MLNNVNIMGRLTRDPELRHTQNSVPVASYTLAINRDFGANGSKEADFIDIVAWQKAAVFADLYFRKGQLVAVQGRLQSRKWSDKDGNNRVSVEVVAERQYFAESKTKAESATHSYASAPGQSFMTTGFDKDFTELKDDDELPF